MEFHKFTVEESNRKMDVIIPKSDDRGYDEYLIQAETEKTRDQLRKKGPPPEPKKGARQELVEQIRERQEYNRRKQDSNRKYF